MRPYPFLILQTTRSVDFVHEVNHTFRIIYWDKTLPDDPDPDYLGYSIARFEGSDPGDRHHRPATTRPGSTIRACRTVRS